ncbi:MAG: hypothetical protein P1V97_24985 [Planctomycetota bacterium]|nr:hypothetical protein [Planctomycetota bacterium]
MFRFLSNRLSGSSPLDGVDFGQEELTLAHDEGLTRVWMTPEGIAISLNDLREVPDLPQSAENIGEFRDGYRASIDSVEDHHMIGMSLVSIDGCESIEAFSKLIHPEFGTMYIGGLVIPFLKSRFMLTVEGRESGVTGLREALLFELMTREGRCHSVARLC